MKNTAKMQNRVDISPIIEQANRYGVSLRATAAAIATATLQAYGLITESNQQFAIDKSKIQRHLQTGREQVRHKPVNGMKCLFFDERKDKTLFVAKINGRHHKFFVTEEHISLISEPGSHYIGHITPQSGKSCDITLAIVNHLTTLSAIGVDGTAVNTGYKTGVIHLLEEHFGKPLQ